MANGVVVVLAVMAGTVGVVALLGALAVASFLVAERTRQIGIRRALGATRGGRHALLPGRERPGHRRAARIGLVVALVLSC